MEKPTYEIVPQQITEAQKAVLTQTTPPEVVKHRKGPGGKMLSYVEHSWVTQQLNLAFNWAWSWEIREWRLIPAEDPTEVFVLGCLTVHTPHGDLVKTQFGSAKVKRSKRGKQPLSIGDDLKAASSDALKKCASLLGLALDVYGGNGPEVKREKGPRKTSSKKQSNSVLTDVATVRAWLEARVEQIDTTHLKTDKAAQDKRIGLLTATLKGLGFEFEKVMAAAWGDEPYSVEQIITLQNLAGRTDGKEAIQHLL